MNETITTIFDHRSVRSYKNEDIGQTRRETLIEVARRTASSTNMQATAIIRVVDEAKKKEIAALAQQDYIAQAPELWIFIVDAHRMGSIVEESGADKAWTGSMDIFMQAFSDACLEAQNVATAAESMGLGSCFLGSILNDPLALVKILELPKLTFPALGLIMGVCAEKPELKPRIDMGLRVYEDKYVPEESYLEAFASYDEEIQNYYDTRDKNRKVAPYTAQVKMRVSVDLPLRRQILKAMSVQGFELEV